MIVLIMSLVVLSFIQSTILPLELVLEIILLRAFLRVDRANLYLAFGFGLLISFLGHFPLGLQSIVYLLLVANVYFLSKTPLSKNIFTCIPAVIVLLTFNDVSTLFLHTQIGWIKILFELLFAFPIYFILKIWEERFIVRSDIKLKI